MAAIKADPLCYEALECLTENHMLTCEEDLLACKAEYYHQCGEYQKCFELTSILLEKDPFHLKSTMVHIAAAMELGHSNELYVMACNLDKDYPQNLNWSVTSLFQATSLDGTFAPGWIGYGNAYAAKEEGDQAMSGYHTAARLFPGGEFSVKLKGDGAWTGLQLLV
ncbi:hypothetical protein L6452_00454 [Arctium lappa]|uniref:Uncharacterized protein n=1 Tax=Arctium lappa TaxID=4217 RepID=A0ACB9FEX8_ARCLA|nr:hypothetical protein L6452_00454 [Arctium lappa]